MQVDEQNTKERIFIMKRIISILLIALMLLSLFACGNDSSNVADTDTKENATENASDEVEIEILEYDGIFQAGFGREDVTPTTFPIEEYKEVHDPLYVSAIAVYDGESTALIITADIKNLSETNYLKLTKQIKQATKVDESCIMFSATHDHSAPTPNGSTATLNKWMAQFMSKTVKACKTAIEDLADAEIYVGSFKTTGMAFVRRYIREDGVFSDFMNIGNSKVIAYESEADDTAQIIRFVRKDKKDILLCNWQCHIASIGTYVSGKISADLPWFLRETVEKDDDLLVAYYQGASGNINCNAKVSGTGKYPAYHKMCQGFADETVKASSLEKMTKINAGKIKGVRETYGVKPMKDSEERIEQAMEAQKNNYSQALLTKYGFDNAHEVDAVLMRIGNRDKEKINIYLGAMSFGDLSFVSVPYEMYDSNGMYVKENSDAKMTFVLTCAGGSYAYVPSTFASKNGGYDAYKTNFEYGTGDEVAGVLVEMLKNLK